MWTARAHVYRLSLSSRLSSPPLPALDAHIHPIIMNNNGRHVSPSTKPGCDIILEDELEPGTDLARSV